MDADTSGTRTPSGAAIVGEFPDGVLQAGRQALSPVGPPDGPFAVVDIPSGQSSWESFIEADKPPEAEDPLMLGLWAITRVYLRPCAKSHSVSPKTVSATAEAFLHQRFNSPIRPRAIELGGYHGLYMEVTTPTDLDIGACNDAEVNLWEGDPDGGYWTRMPGMVSRLWILDVEDRPMVIHLAVPPSATDPQVHAMTEIVEAATFETARD